MNSSGKSFVQVKGVSRSFGSLWALKDVSLTVEPGQIHVILGHNGAGKTTLFRILLGLLRPTRGTASVAGYNTWCHREGLLARSKMGALLESNGLYERLSAWENLELAARIYGLERRSWQVRAEEFLKKVNLLDRKDEIVKGWSAGMRRKIALLRAILHNPSLVILDEPIAGLDATTKHTIRDHVKHLAVDENIALLIATQNLFEAEKIATHITILRQGKVMYTGSHSDLYDRVPLKRYRLRHSVSGSELGKLLRGGKIVRQDEDRLGLSVLVRYDVSAPLWDDSERHRWNNDIIIEAPVLLEDVYIELSRTWEDADAY